MSLFNEILSEVSKHLKANESNKKDIAEAISVEIGTVVKVDEIKIKDGTLFINVSPTLKSLIYLRRKKILEKLKVFSINLIQ